MTLWKTLKAILLFIVAHVSTYKNKLYFQNISKKKNRYKHELEREKNSLGSISNRRQMVVTTSKRYLYCSHDWVFQMNVKPASVSTCRIKPSTKLMESTCYEIMFKTLIETNLTIVILPADSNLLLLHKNSRLLYWKIRFLFYFFMIST